MLEYVNHKIKDESFVFNICYQNYTYPKISQQQTYTANVNRQTTDKLLFSHAIITDENM